MADEPSYWSKRLQSRYGRRRLLRASGAGAISAAALAGGLACGSKGTKSGTTSTQSKGVIGAPTTTSEQAKYGGKFVYITPSEPPTSIRA